MGGEAFDEKLLAEKLTKLNSSQQSIESLSRWCISHRKRAKPVVETWESLFKSSQPGQRVSFLYLANDILQNSRRKGSEFVNEFWKVLPMFLKRIYESGDESCRKVASRLVDIWEERKVFGSRGQNLKNEMMGKNPSPVVIPKISNPIKIVKRDANSLRIKLSVGCMPEKILSSFHLIHDEIVNEEDALSKCRTAISPDSDSVDTMEEHEKMLHQCITQLENSKAIRAALVSQLREAIEDQESKLELIQSEIILAKGQIEQASNTRQMLTSPPGFTPTTTMIQLTDPVEPTFSPVQPTYSPIVSPPTVPPSNITEGDNNKVTAAALAAQLTASSSPEQMFTSILSSLMAEEAAASKRPKLETNNAGGTNSSYFPNTEQQTMTNMPSRFQNPFLPPPPPLMPPANPAAYGYVGGNLPPAPFSSNPGMVLARPGPPPQQAQPQNQPPPQQQQQQMQQPLVGGYYRPLGMGVYGHSHQPSTPPIHRQ